MSFDQLSLEVLKLPLEDRVRLAEKLWESVGAVDAGDEQEAVAVAEIRDAEMKSGKVVGRSHAEVMAAARAALKCD